MGPNREEKSREARRLCEQGLWQEVLAFAQEWHHQNSKDYKALYYMGLGLSGTGQFTHAEIAYRKALSLNRSDPLVWNNLAGVLFESLQRQADAIGCLEQAVKLDPGYKIGWANLASMAGRLGHHDKALNYADRALALDRDLVEAHLHKASAAMALGRTEIVKEVCQTLSALSPEKFRRAR